MNGGILKEETPACQLLDELHSNVSEVVALCLESYRGDIRDLPRFVGL